ncbi:MAG: siderophore-interacting protein [Pseudomonadales bacterium]|nr:siderophore-interacting protein [Pseudomonadales bacterium]
MSGPLLLTVVSSTQISPFFQRVTFTGEGLQRIPDESAGLHIKLFFKHSHQTELVLPKLINNRIRWPEQHKRPISRTYSIRRYHRQSNILEVDFVLHEQPGIASTFAAHAMPGDTVGFAGPGPKPLYYPDSKSFLLIGDLSALPAIAAIVDELPEAVPVNVLIEVPKHAPLSGSGLGIDSKRQVNITWRFITQTFNPKASLLGKVEQFGLDYGDVSITLAGEHHSVVLLRDYFRTKGVVNNKLYSVPYWRHEMTEEAYHEERHEVMEA